MKKYMLAIILLALLILPTSAYGDDVSASARVEKNGYSISSWAEAGYSIQSAWVRVSATITGKGVSLSSTSSADANSGSQGAVQAVTGKGVSLSSTSSADANSGSQGAVQAVAQVVYEGMVAFAYGQARYGGGDEPSATAVAVAADDPPPPQIKIKGDGRTEGGAQMLFGRCDIERFWYLEKQKRNNDLTGYKKDRLDYWQEVISWVGYKITPEEFKIRYPLNGKSICITNGYTNGKNGAKLKASSDNEPEWVDVSGEI